MTDNEYERGYDAGYIEGKRERTTAPSHPALLHALQIIQDDATGHGSTQLGAAMALGALAEACDLQPGGEIEDIVKALIAMTE